MKLCWFYQKALCWQSDRAHPSRWVERHTRGCSHCRQIAEFERQLTLDLVRTAPHYRADLPPDLHRRIVAGLREKSAPPARPAWTFSWREAVLFPALALLVLTIYWGSRPRPQEPPTLANRMISSYTSQSNPGPAQPDPSQFLAWTEHAEKPLQQELHSIVSDAKSALQSLKGNFLPEQN